MRNLISNRVTLFFWTPGFRGKQGELYRRVAKAPLPTFISRIRSNQSQRYSNAMRPFNFFWRKWCYRALKNFRSFARCSIIWKLPESLTEIPHWQNLCARRCNRKIWRGRGLTNKEVSYVLASRPVKKLKGQEIMPDSIDVTDKSAGWESCSLKVSIKWESRQMDLKLKVKMDAKRTIPLPPEVKKRLIIIWNWQGQGANYWKAMAMKPLSSATTNYRNFRISIKLFLNKMVWNIVDREMSRPAARFYGEQR